MTVAGISSSFPLLAPASTAPATPAGSVASPAVEIQQLESEMDSTLFAGASGDPSDLGSLMPALVATSLYSQPGLLPGLTAWGGSMLAGSERAAGGADTSVAPAPAAPTAGTLMTGTLMNGDSTDVTNPDGTTGTVTGTGTVVPSVQYAFNPFDQSSWWTDPLGSTVDTSA